MKRIAVGTVLAVLASAVVLRAVQATPETPQTQWLKKLVGEWESDSEVIGDPSQPAMKFKGAETGRAVGDHWVVLEIKSDSPMGPMTGILTVGYDPEKKKFVGTWIDSVSGNLWIYDGKLEGDTLTLDTEGPSPMLPGKRCEFREQIEFKDKDHRIFTSSMQGDNGEWTKFVTVNAKRKG